MPSRKPRNYEITLQPTASDSDSDESEPPSPKPTKAPPAPGKEAPPAAKDTAPEAAPAADPPKKEYKFSEARKAAERQRLWPGEAGFWAIPTAGPRRITPFHQTAR